MSPDAPDAAIERGAAARATPTPGSTVSASGFLPGCLACRADAAFDGDPATAWQTPFDQRRRASGRRSTSPRAGHGRPSRPLGDRRRPALGADARCALDVDGQVPRAHAAADRRPAGRERDRRPCTSRSRRCAGSTVRVTIDGVREERTKLFGTAATRVEPVGIAELRHPGRARSRPRAPGAVDSGCRSDLVAIDGRPVPVRVTGPVAAAADDRRASTVAPCGGALALGAGRARAARPRAGKDVGFSIDRLVLASGTERDARRPSRAVTCRSPSRRRRRPTVDVVHNGDTKMRVHVDAARRSRSGSCSASRRARAGTRTSCGGARPRRLAARRRLRERLARRRRPRRARSTSCSNGRRSGRCGPRSGCRCSASRCASAIIGFTWARRRARRRHRGDRRGPATPTSTSRGRAAGDPAGAPSDRDCAGSRRW